MKIKNISLFVVATLLLSCSIEKQSATTHMPQVQKLGKQFAMETSKSQKFRTSEPVAKWWTQFKDDDLTYLVNKGFKNNFDIKIAMANFLKSRAIVEEAGTAGLPTMDIRSSYTRQQLSEEGFFGDLQELDINLYDVGLDAFWEVDLFGRLAQNNKRALAINKQALADLELISMTITAEIVRNYIILRGEQYLLQIAKRNLENQSKIYTTALDLFESGLGIDLDVKQAKSELRLIEANIPTIEANIARSIRRLSVLTGDIPTSLFTRLREEKRLPDIPQSIAMGNPTDLLRRRADIQKAEQQLMQAFAEYNLAYSDLFPRVTLKGSIGFIATAFGRWLTAGALETNFGPSISWKILNLQRVLARIDQNDATTKNRIYSYQKTVLNALEETENAIDNFSKEEVRRNHLVQAAQDVNSAVDIAQQRFEKGIDPILRVLDVQRSQLNIESQLVRSETNLCLQLVILYKALGGGWYLPKSTR
ncbi:efflux transporter outer membrane subunit [Candidatus Uabimicrobium amorphum]|uniref:RND transporter n=1 Tax=Uabimicrobium amorphum TaxID=2596890 RepID=A0A5S9IJW8_UABAM|nr:efflux transporter outer membrane subunit [Candidatus Uabimicrobium amorphum]BBM83064.1 RND transporter [Candidatus Uabimicrobium amorphum]